MPDAAHDAHPDLGAGTGNVQIRPRDALDWLAGALRRKIRSRPHEWAVAAINAKGGVNGKKLEMIIARHPGGSTGGNQRRQSARQRRKGSGLRHGLVIGRHAVAPIANDNKVVELSIGANSPDIAKLGDYVYTTFPLADVDVAALARYSVKKMG